MGGNSFSWPAVGRLSQTYGCTGFRLNPPRGSCRHFHDGLDIVAGYGSPVRTAADGVVAFAGWNPWDEGGRAWIMVVSHPDGYVTRYGHLLPGGRARVGQFVRQGQAIGRMGNTGKSTGTHLHFELLHGSTPLSPWGYLPAGMVTIKPAKHPGRQANRKHERGGKRARGKGRAGQRGAGSRAAAEGDASAAAAGAPSGQVFEVDLASMPFIPAPPSSPRACVRQVPMSRARSAPRPPMAREQVAAGRMRARRTRQPGAARHTRQPEAAGLTRATMAARPRTRRERRRLTSGVCVLGLDIGREPRQSRIRRGGGFRGRHGPGLGEAQGAGHGIRDRAGPRRADLATGDLADALVSRRPLACSLPDGQPHWRERASQSVRLRARRIGDGYLLGAPFPMRCDVWPLGPGIRAGSAPGPDEGHRRKAPSMRCPRSNWRARDSVVPARR